MDVVDRRLAALLSADAVGYTRLMADDELATVRAITRSRELFAEQVGRRRGRVVDSPGDNLLAEFPSALDAIECAVAVQLELGRRNAELDERRRMPFRIGVHLGDVMVEGERIYGDGVIIAARLEGLAEPGGICLSGAVHEQVRGKLERGFEDLGFREVKNVRHPVRVYRVLLDGAPAAPAADSVSGFDRPAIAVLPFDNLSPDPEQDYLADGIAADLIPLLAAWRAFPVIARNSSFTYKGRAVDVKQVSRELGARYLVSGSVRAAGPRLRVSAELVDATTGQNLWAEKYDRGLVEIFDVQDEVTEAIVSALQPALRRAEAERARRQPPESLEAWALVNRAWLELQGDVGNRDTAAATRRAAERAIEMDPEYALAHAVRAFATSLMWPGRSEAPEWRDDVVGGLRRALALQPDDPQLRQLQGAIMGNLAQTQEAMAAYERSLELDPSNAQARAGLGIAMVFARRAKEGLVHIDRARELSPRDPLLYNALAYRALACVVLERYEEAAADARASLERTPTRTAWLALALALAALDRLEEAGLAREELERFESGTTVTLYEPYVRSLAPTPADADRLFDAMRRAGFPD